MRTVGAARSAPSSSDRSRDERVAFLDGAGRRASQRAERSVHAKLALCAMEEAESTPTKAFSPGLTGKEATRTDGEGDALLATVGSALRTLARLAEYSQ